MKKHLVIIGIVALVLTTWLSGCQSQGISVHKISGEHQNSVNMTEEQMNNFPHLKEAILTNKMVETPPAEMNQLRGILEFFNTEIIQYQNEYYEIGFFAAD
jgi:nitrate reductase cytochrome c-type subunit